MAYAHSSTATWQYPRGDSLAQSAPPLSARSRPSGTIRRVLKYALLGLLSLTLALLLARTIHRYQMDAVTVVTPKTYLEHEYPDNPAMLDPQYGQWDQKQVKLLHRHYENLLRLLKETEKTKAN